MQRFLAVLSINLVFVFTESSTPNNSQSFSNAKCSPKLIRFEQCRNKFYKYTRSGGERDIEIQEKMNKFVPILNEKCSNGIEFMLCSVYIPHCDPETKTIVRPCATVCKEVKRQCEPFLNSFKLQWPMELNCSQFQDNQIPELACMSIPTKNNDSKSIEVRKIKRTKKPYGQCQHLRHSYKYVFINRTGRCALTCFEDSLFSRESKTFAEVWMLVVTVVSFLMTLFTCLTCCHSDRIRYPEQPIIFLTLSYNLYSVSLLLRVFFTRSTVSCDLDPVSGHHILIQEGLENTHCAITFLLNFFFSTATHFWWVTIGGCWMLYSVWNVSVSTLTKNAGYFHLFVWLSTSMLTISVLVLRCVEADELLGVCSVGGQSPDLLMTFSIIPKSVCLILGMLLLAIGFVFFKQKKRGNNGKLKKPLPITTVAFRMGLFTGVYVVAVSVHIACECYQFFSYNSWKWAPEISKNVKEPMVAVFLLNIFVSQVVGINSAIWIWSLDAATSWKKFLVALISKLEKKSAIQDRKGQYSKTTEGTLN